MNKIGTLIKEVRTSEGLTQRQLVALGDLSRCYFISVENNHYIPSISYLKKVSKGLSRGDEVKYHEILTKFINALITD